MSLRKISIVYLVGQIIEDSFALDDLREIEKTTFELTNHFFVFVKYCNDFEAKKV